MFPDWSSKYREAKVATFGEMDGVHPGGNTLFGFFFFKLINMCSNVLQKKKKKVSGHAIIR